jgi:hypothetical protein
MGIMKFNLRSTLPQSPAHFAGLRIIRFATALYMLVIVVRSCIHLFAPDGGALSIAGVDITVAGGDNIVAMFHQWGASQLLLVALLFVLFFRYPGLTPLILLALATDPILRAISGQILPVTTVGTPPGAALNWPSFGLLMVLFVLSLLERNPKKAAA